MGYCCIICPEVPNYYLDVLNKLQKRVFRPLGPLLLLNNLPHRRNVVNLSLLHIRHALRNLAPFVKFKKPEKHPLRSVTFGKAAGTLLTEHSYMGVIHIF